MTPMSEIVHKGALVHGSSILQWYLTWPNFRLSFDFPPCSFSHSLLSLPFLQKEEYLIKKKHLYKNSHHISREKDTGGFLCLGCAHHFFTQIFYNNHCLTMSYFSHILCQSSTFSYSNNLGSCILACVTELLNILSNMTILGNWRCCTDPPQEQPLNHNYLPPNNFHFKGFFL